MMTPELSPSLEELTAGKIMCIVLPHEGIENLEKEKESTDGLHF